VAGVDSLSTPLTCDACHGSVTFASATHMNGGIATFAWSPLATTGGLTPVYTAATGTCTAVYCHGNAMPGGDTSGTTRSPTWTSTLPATLTAAACGSCHGFPPSTAAGHPAVTIPPGFPATATIGTTCSCHSNINTAGNSYATIFVNKALHINGILEPPASGHAFPYPGATHMTATGATTPATGCASCHNTTATGAYPVAAGTAPNCRACHTVGLLRTVATSSCYDCHGASATDGRPNGNFFPNYSGTHTKHVVNQAMACTACHANGGTGSANHGSSNRIASTGIAFVHVTSTTRQFHFTPPTTTGRGTCSNVACHGTATWGGTLGCVDCHGVAVTAPAAQALDATVTQRRAITPEFARTWSHKRSAAGVVTNDDCIVCHMEGNPTTHSTVAGVHANGRINLRDPDTGLNIKGVTHNGTTTTAGAYTSTAVDSAPVRFSRNLASTTIEPDTAAMEQNLCLKCHDANGALSSTAWVTGGSALKPFATTITGHAAPFNSNGTGNVVNVAKSFVSTNAAYHPVVSKANNSYTQGTKMVAPWNITKTTGNNTQYGNLMTCWDCHAPAGATGVQTATVTAHGAVATLRAPIRAGGATAALNLCIVCHATTYATTAQNHGTGSAFGAGGSSMSSTSTFVNCYYCHGYNGAVGATVVAASTRPNRAEDVHGTNDRTAGTANSKWTSGAGPYAFIRNTLSDWRPLTAAGVTFTGTLTSSQCLGTSGTCNNNMSSRTYTPGGAY
jgi:predicted CxxxxCH...CXXCH cytochrome family protein